MLKGTFLQLPVSAQPHTRAHNSQGGKEQDDLVFLEKVGFHLLFIDFILYISLGTLRD